MSSVNQTAGYGAKIINWAINGWNGTIKPTFEKFLNQTDRVVFKEIIERKADTINEIVKQAGCFVMPLVGSLVGKVVSFCQFAWAFAAAHPVAAAIIVLVFVVPVFIEYYAAHERFTLKTPLVIMWMLITRPFRLVWRILCHTLVAIFGVTEVNMVRLTRKLPEAQQTAEQLQEEIVQLQQTAKQSQEEIAQLQGTIAQLRDLCPILRQELRAKQQAVLDVIGAMGNGDPQVILRFTANGIFQLTDEIIQNPSTPLYSIQENYFRVLIENPQCGDVKAAFDEWEKCLNLCILTR
ncbi:MAG: hypothetical protein LBF49_02805 [Puniceicoccales bacterium]|nr:hypothetical protein [Puniceicoccales bacterium]